MSIYPECNAWRHLFEYRRSCVSSPRRLLHKFHKTISNSQGKCRRWVLGGNFCQDSFEVPSIMNSFTYHFSLGNFLKLESLKKNLNISVSLYNNSSVVNPAGKVTKLYTIPLSFGYASSV